MKGIYEEIEKLEDIQFLIRYAKVLFAGKSDDIDPVVVRDNMIRLQGEMAAEREAALSSLRKVLKGEEHIRTFEHI